MMADTIKMAVTINWLRVEIFVMSPQSRSFHPDAGDREAAGGLRAGANLACTGEQPVNNFLRFC
jgi:hypothetical protein